jgi:hypothetical protein
MYSSSRSVSNPISLGMSPLTELSSKFKTSSWLGWEEARKG